MKYRNMLLLTSLLTPIVPAWGMEPDNQNNGDICVQRTPSHQLPFEREMLVTSDDMRADGISPDNMRADNISPVGASSELVCSPIDPRCGRRNPLDPRPGVNKPLLSNMEFKVHIETQPELRIEMSVMKKTALSKIEEGQVLNYLQNFGFSDTDSTKLWEEFSQFMTAKGQLRPLKLASLEPHYIAAGLWRAHLERPNQTNESALSYSCLLSCLLSHEVYVKGKSFRTQDLHTLKSLVQSNPYFTTLDLFQCKVEDPQLAFLITIPHLKTLSLEENNITDNVLPLVIKHPRLEKLTLSKNKITPEGAKILAQSPKIKDLDLSDNPIGDRGAEYLSQNPVFSRLDLRKAGIGNPGATALAKNKTLFSLILSDNKINDAGALPFLENEHLRCLDIKQNPSISKNVRFHVEHLLRDREIYLNQLSNPFSALPPTLLPTQKPRVRILSIDGGGIRGLLPAAILKHIADELTQKIGAPFHFAKHVDLMAGTSTGGLIGLGLVMPGENGLPKYTPQTLVDLYTNRGKDIFPAPWSCLKGVYESKYPTISLENILTEYFEDFCLSSCVSNTLITSFDLKTKEPHIFDSFQAKMNESKDFTMAGASRATSAAPTYFSSAKIMNKLGKEFELVDGGLYANNPTLLALLRAQQLYPNAQEYVVFSFGTGQTEKQSLSPLGDAGLVRWGLNITDVLMDNASTYTENILKDKCAQDPRIKYVRIQPSIESSSKEMDNIQTENIQNLLTAAQKTIVQEKKNIDFIIDEFHKIYGSK